MSHRIVIVGGGAGGLELATRLGKTLGKRGTASVMLVDANLTHIWKPLLHEVAAGSLNSSEDELNYVAQAKWNHFEFQLGRMSGLDRAQKKIQLAATYDENGVELVPAREVQYDSLVISVGSTTNDFGTQGAAQHCLFLDTRKQAERFHQQLLNHYLRAHAGQTDVVEQISVAIVGAGATGVELAAELHNAAHELAAYGLDRIKPENMHITLIEAGPRVLPALPERISGPVHKTLKTRGQCDDQRFGQRSDRRQPDHRRWQRDQGQPESLGSGHSRAGFPQGHRRPGNQPHQSTASAADTANHPRREHLCFR